MYLSSSRITSTLIGAVSGSLGDRYSRNRQQPHGVKVYVCVRACAEASRYPHKKKSVYPDVTVASHSAKTHQHKCKANNGVKNTYKVQYVPVIAFSIDAMPMRWCTVLYACKRLDRQAAWWERDIHIILLAP